MKEFDMTDIDELSKRVSDLVAEIDTLAKAKHTYTFSHDDGADDGDDGDYEGVSNPSLERNDLDAENGDDNDDDDELEKATINAAQLRNDHAQRPGALKESSHSQSRHKFEALVSKIVNDQGLPRSQAMAYARVQYPDVYSSYQAFSTAGTTAKRAPDLVEAEMMKGCSREVALQRVAQLHGFRAFDTPSLSKAAARAEDAEFDLITKANEVWADSGLSRCEALREARLNNPALHKRLTRV
jgi:hypothetical protein